MTVKTLSEGEGTLRFFTKSLLASFGVLILTVIHHLYGAEVFDTPWRRHVVVIAVPVVLVLTALWAADRYVDSLPVRKALMMVFIILVLIVPVIMFGFYEGGYNHVVKNILFFSGVSPSTMDWLFPPPIYEMPGDLIFEATGILQFPAGIWAAYYTVPLWKRFVDKGIDG